MIIRAAITKSLIVIVFLTVGIIFIVGSLQTSQITIARSLLQEALDTIKTPAPGQIAHYTYQQFLRGPSADLEPADPYHKPYSEIWHASNQIETWLEVRSDGKTIRWRTQLRDRNGTLLQDLFFDGEMETDYFPLDDFADKFPMEAEKFRDFRLALIEDILLNENLVHKPNVSHDGRTVLSVYSEVVPVSDNSAWKDLNIEEALLSFQNPFVADLSVSSTANRIDFDPNSSHPIGAAQVIFDSNDAEVVVFYQTFGDFEILSNNDSEYQGLFEQDIPERAFNQFYVAPSGRRALNNMNDILAAVDYPIYALSSSTAPFKLLSASLTFPDTSSQPPAFRRGIDSAATLGVGPILVYANDKETMSLLVIQGPKKLMRETFRQTLPDWVKSVQIEARLGHEDVTGWNLINPQTNLVRTVFETGETIIYIEGKGIQFEQLMQLLGFFKAVD